MQINTTLHAPVPTPATDDAQAGPGSQHQEQHEAHAEADSSPPATVLLDHTAQATVMAKLNGGVHQELVISTRVVRSPGDSAMPTFSHPGDVFHAAPSNLAVGSVPEMGHQGSLAVDRTSLLAKASGTVGGTNLSGAAGVVAGAAYAEFAMQTAGGTRITLASIVNPGIGGVGLSLAHTVGTVAMSSGLFAVGNVDVIAQVKSVQKDKVRIDYKKLNLFGLQLTAGFTSGAFGIGGRLFGSHAKEVRLSRWETKEYAAEVMSKQGYFQRKMQGVGLMPAVFSLPNFTDPALRLASDGQQRLFMNLEDEITIISTNSITEGVAANLGGIYLGAHASVRGEHQLSILRADEHIMRVALAPSTKATSRGISLDLPFLASAQASISRVSTSHSIYEFDLTHEAAQTAYKAMVAGILPGPVIRIDDSLADHPQTTLRMLNAQTLPQGVSLISLSYATTPVQVRAEAGMSGLSYITGDRVVSLSIKRISGRAQYIQATEKHIINRKEWSNEWRTELLRPGATSTAATMVCEVIHVGPEAASSAQATVLRASRNIDRPSPKQRQAAVAWLNEHILIGTSVPLSKFAEAPNTYSYGITVERILEDADLATLLDRRAIPNDSKLATAWLLAGQTPEKRRYVMNLFTDKIAKRIRNIGPTEVGRLHRILGDDSKLIISISSDAPKRLKQKADLAAVKYHLPLDLEAATTKQLERRVSQVNKLVERIEEAKQLAGSDPVAKKFVPDATADDVKEMAEILQTVLPLVSVDHLSEEKQVTLNRRLRSRSRERLDELNKTRRASSHQILLGSAFRAPTCAYPRCRTRHAQEKTDFGQSCVVRPASHP